MLLRLPLYPPYKPESQRLSETKTSNFAQPGAEEIADKIRIKQLLFLPLGFFFLYPFKGKVCPKVRCNESYYIFINLISILFVNLCYHISNILWSRQSMRVAVATKQFKCKFLQYVKLNFNNIWYWTILFSRPVSRMQFLKR